MSIQKTISVKGEKWKISTGCKTEKEAAEMTRRVRDRLIDLAELSDGQREKEYKNFIERTQNRPLTHKEKVELRYYKKRCITEEENTTKIQPTIEPFFAKYWEQGEPTQKKVKEIKSLLHDLIFYLKEEKKIIHVEKLDQFVAEDYFTRLRSDGPYSRICRKSKKRKKRESSIISKSTYNVYLAIAKAYFKYLSRQYPFIKLLEIEPLKKDNNSSQRRKPFEDFELNLIEENLDKLPDYLRHAYKISINTGLRLADCFNFGWADIGMFRGAITLTIAAQKTRHHDNKAPLRIPISDELYEYFKEHGDLSHQFLFPSARLYHYRTLDIKDEYEYNRETSSTFGEFLGKIGIKRFVDTKRTKNFTEKSFHSLRHTFAKLMVESRVDINTLTFIMGHESVKMNQIYSLHYTESGANDVKNAIEAGKLRREAKKD